MDFPLVGEWVSMVTIELDEKGRALLPASVRRKVRSRRFRVNVKSDRIELLPIEDMKSLKGKYKGRIKTSWDLLEEKAERFVREGKR